MKTTTRLQWQDQWPAVSNRYEAFRTVSVQPSTIRAARKACVETRPRFLTMDVPFLHPDQSEFIPMRRVGGLYVDKTGQCRVAVGLNFIGGTS